MGGHLALTQPQQMVKLSLTTTKEGRLWPKGRCGKEGHRLQLSWDSTSARTSGGSAHQRLNADGGTRLGDLVAQRVSGTVRLGPRSGYLARAGVAAVLAMQGTVPVATVTRLLPALFRELGRDGVVDRALAAARVALALHGDAAWWVPVLFLRGAEVRLWRATPALPELLHASAALESYLARTLAAHQAWLLEALPRRPRPPIQPYRALLAFTVADTELFFGRSAALEALTAQVLTNRLLVLHARSGAGKTSLLNAGLVPRLFDEGWLPIVIRTSHDPLHALKTALARPALGPWPTLLPGIQLPALLSLLCQQWIRPQHPLVLIFDQFEELFTLQPEPALRARFAADLATCLADTNLPVHVILSVRGDHLTDLDSLAQALPSILDQRYRLAPMSRSEAHEAITQPLARLQPLCSCEPTLLPVLLADLTAMGMELPQYRHLRGGAWQYSADFARSDAMECWQAPDQRHTSIGFRLCFQVAEEEQPS
ncbi:MAG: hypothetical protein WCP31_07185 [Chloroflexales bacterium]